MVLQTKMYVKLDMKTYIMRQAKEINFLKILVTFSWYEYIRASVGRKGNFLPPWCSRTSWERGQLCPNSGASAYQ